MIAAHVVVGSNARARGAALRGLVTSREGRWAVFACALPDTAFDERITVRVAPAGCACCVGLVAFRVALVRLLRETRPDALAVELVADDHTERVLATLAEESFARVLRVESITRTDAT